MRNAGRIVRRGGRVAVAAYLMCALGSAAWAAPAAPDSTSGLDLGAASAPSGRTEARIRYTVTRAVTVQVSILDARGRLILVLPQGVRQPGRHEARWNGLTASGAPAPTGMYIAHVEAGSESGSRHLVLVQ